MGGIRGVGRVRVLPRDSPGWRPVAAPGRAKRYNTPSRRTCRVCSSVACTAASWRAMSLASPAALAASPSRAANRPVEMGRRLAPFGTPLGLWSEADGCAPSPPPSLLLKESPCCSGFDMKERRPRSRPHSPESWRGGRVQKARAERARQGRPVWRHKSAHQVCLPRRKQMQQETRPTHLDGTHVFSRAGLQIPRSPEQRLRPAQRVPGGGREGREGERMQTRAQDGPLFIGLRSADQRRRAARRLTRRWRPTGSAWPQRLAGQAGGTSMLGWSCNENMCGAT